MRVTIASGQEWRLFYEDIVNGAIYIELEQPFEDGGKSIATVQISGWVEKQIVDQLKKTRQGNVEKES